MRARSQAALRAVLLAGVALACAAPVAAQVDPSGPWRTWRSVHFRIHARAELAAAVPEIAAEAERAYALLARELEPPRGTIDLVVADNFDMANGFATVFPTNRLTIYRTRPTDTPSLPYFDSWPRLVLTHELTHLFHLDRVDGIWEVLQSLFGRAPGLFPHAYQPTWVIEGIATYYESRLTMAGRNRGGHHRALLTAAALGNAWPQPWDATVTSPKWPAGNRPYAWGGEFFALQGARGDSVIPRFIARGAGQLWPFLVSRPLQRAGGTGVDEGWRRLRRERTVAPSAPVESREVLVPGLRSLPHASVAPSGGRLVYLHDDGRTVPEMRVVDLATLRLLAAHRVNGQAQAEWVGDTLYLTQLEFTSPVEVRSQLYRWVPGRVWERVPAAGRVRHPFVAPGGRPGVVAVDGAPTVRRLASGGGWSEGAVPTAADAVQQVGWSEVGDRVVAALHRDGRWDVAVWPASDPTDTRWITDDAALDLDPVFAVDGGTVFFASERRGLPQIYAWDVATGALRRVTDEPAGAREPAVTADGHVLYAALLHDGYALVRAVPQSTAAPSGAATPPAFQPAPAVRVEEGAYDPWAALRPSFWLPYGHDEAHTGVFFGVVTAGADPIGRTTYGLFAGMAGRPLRWEALATVQHVRWRRVGLDLRLSQLWEGVHGGLLGERERRADVGLTVRWRRWRRSLSARVSADLVRTALFDDAADGALLASTPTLVGGTVRFEAAYHSRPALSISPEDGVRVEALARRRWGWSDPAWATELSGAVSGYLALPLPGFAHWVLAARVAGGRTGGPARTLYELGGASGEPIELLPGTVLGKRRSFPLRGYPEAGLVSRAVIAAVELRIPVLLVGRGLWKTPFGLDRFSMTLFGEVGGGWNEGGAASLPLRDVGAEAVVDLGTVYDVGLRVRGGVGVPLADGLGVTRGEARAYVTVGTAF